MKLSLDFANQKRVRFRSKQLALLPPEELCGIVVKHVAVANSLRYMAKNYARPFKIQDLMLSGLSRRGFFKAFRRHVGQTPAQVLRRLRMEHAKRLLREGDLSMKELAKQSGYRSVNSFWVAFRQATGLSPKRFQRGPRWQIP